MYLQVPAESFSELFLTLSFFLSYLYLTFYLNYKRKKQIVNIWQKTVDNYKYWNIIVNIRQREEQHMGIENYHITLKIELDLEQLGFDEEDAKETATSYIDDYLNELFRKDNNISDWDIKAEINRNY
nr:MAG TPA: hypothetical protein [Caudoviricetes sp.]